MSSPFKQEMDKRLKTLIIKNFKWFNPTANKDSSNYFLAETPKRPSSDSEAILSHLSLSLFLFFFFFPSSSFLLSFCHLFCKVYNHIQLFFKPNLNLEILKPNYQCSKMPDVSSDQLAISSSNSTLKFMTPQNHWKWSMDLQCNTYARRNKLVQNNRDIRKGNILDAT